MQNYLKIHDLTIKIVNDAPGLHITFHKGINAMIGENDSGNSCN